MPARDLLADPSRGLRIVYSSTISVDELPIVHARKMIDTLFLAFLFEKPTRMGPDEKCLNRHRVGRGGGGHAMRTITYVAA